MTVRVRKVYCPPMTCTQSIPNKVSGKFIMHKEDFHDLCNNLDHYFSYLIVQNPLFYKNPKGGYFLSFKTYFLVLYCGSPTIKIHNKAMRVPIPSSCLHFSKSLIIEKKNLYLKQQNGTTRCNLCFLFYTHTKRLWH